MTLQWCFTCLVVCLAASPATANHHGQLENFYYNKDMDKGMFSYGFEVEPMESTKSKDFSTGMTFGVRHHRHDDGTQSFSYAIGSGPLPASVFQGLGRPGTETTPRPAASAPSSSESPVLAVRSGGPSAAAVTPGVFQATNGGFNPVYVRRDQLPAQYDPLDGQLLLGSQKVHQVVPFHGNFGERLPRRLQPDESASQWRGQSQTGGFRQRQQIRHRQPEQQQQQQPTLYPSEELQEPEVYSPEQQEEPPVTTYRPSYRPTLATAALEESVNAPGVGFGQSTPSAPIQVTQVAAAAQPVTEFRSADGGGPLPGPDPRFQGGQFAARAPGPLPPGVFPPGVGGTLPFGFNQQGPLFDGNFPIGPAQGFNGFPQNNFFGNVNAGPQNNGFFGNDFPPTSGSSFGDRTNQLADPNNGIRTSDQLQTTERYPQDNLNQFSGPQQVSNEPSSTGFLHPQSDSQADQNHSTDFTKTPSETNDVASPDNDRSSAQSDNERRRYRDGDSGRFTNAQTTSKRPRIQSRGRRPSQRRQQATSDPSPLLSASLTPDTTDDQVFAEPDSSSGGSRSGEGFRKRPSKAILLTAASVFQDDTTSRQELARVAAGRFIDPLNGKRIVIRRRMKKIPRVSTDDTTKPSAASEDGHTETSTTEAPQRAKLIDDESNQDNDEHTTTQPTYEPDQHLGPQPRVLAVGRRRNRLRPGRKTTSTTETPATGANLDDVHPVEAPPTRRNRQKSRQRSRQREDNASNGQGSDGNDELIATGEGSESDAVLARPPTDRISLLEQRKATRRANRLRNNRRRPSDRSSDGSDDDTSSTEDELESGRPGNRRRNRPASRRRGRPQRGPGIVRPGQRTTPAPDAELETTAPPELAITTPSGMSGDGETSFSTVATAPTEEPARRRGASQLRRPGRPGGRRWRTQQNDDDAEDRGGPTTASSLPSQPSAASTLDYPPTTASGADYTTSSAQGYLPTTAPGVTHPPSTSESPGYLPTTALGVSYPPRTSEAPGYLPTTASGVSYRPSTSQASGYFPTATSGISYTPSTSQAQSYLPTTASGLDYTPSTAQGPSYFPSTEPGLTTVPTTVRPRSLVDRYREDHLAVARAREERLRAQFDRNLAASREQQSDDDAHEEGFRSLFNRKLDEKLSVSVDDSQLTTTSAPTIGDDRELDEEASRAERIQALFAQYTKATQPPSTTTTTTDPPFLISTTIDPSSREAKLQALFAQYTKGTTTADPTSITSAADLQKLFALHAKTIGTTVPTPVVVESFKSAVSRVGATPSSTTQANQDENDGLHPTRDGYPPLPTTPSPSAGSTVADVPPRAGTRQPYLNRSQAPSPLGSTGGPASTLRPPFDDGEDQGRDQERQRGTTTRQRTSSTTRHLPATHVPVTEPTTEPNTKRMTEPTTSPSTSSTDPTQWTLDDILERARPTTRFGSPKSSGNEVSFSDAPRTTTTRRPSRRPTRRPEPARPFDGFNGIDDQRHAEKLTLDDNNEQKTETGASGPELLLPVRSGAQSVAVSLLAVLLSSWLSLTAHRLTL